MNHAIILAGGAGTRFWPLSRELEPKQFLNICSGKSMFEESCRRINSLIEKKNVYIAANKAHRRRIKKHASESGLLFKNILFEPQGRNTLAPIGILSRRINDVDNNAVVVVLPCDQCVKDKSRFLRLLKQGIDIAMQGHIVVLGIHPTRPETGYGYVKARLHGQGKRLRPYYEVDRYIEKPQLSRAKIFIKDIRYYWNSGIFIFRPDVILEEIKRLMPSVYKIIIQIRAHKDIGRLWQRLPSISIDYAIMEKTKKLVLLPADYGWQDVGSWQAALEMSKKDKDGNVLKGNCLAVASKNTLIWSDNRLVTALGLDSMIVVDTKDALLVCRKDMAQDIRLLVNILKQKRKTCV